MRIRIRPGGPDDVDTAVDIYFRSGTARRNGRPVPDFRVEEITDSLRLPEAWLFIAEDEGVPVAIAHAKPSRTSHGTGPLVPGLCYLYLLFVVPERWGEGIGGQLLDFVLEDSKERGYTRIHLWTQDDNERSRALYRSRAFARTGRSGPGLTDPDMIVSEWARSL